MGWMRAKTSGKALSRAMAYMVGAEAPIRVKTPKIAMMDVDMFRKMPTAFFPVELT